MISRLFAALALMALPFSLAAQVTVNGGGNYTTIQAAVNAANNGDIINAAAQTYSENVTITGKSVTVNAVTGATINGGGTGPAFSITGAAATGTVIRGFNITNAGKPAASGAQGGIYISNSTPTISTNILTANFCAGIYVSNGNAVIIGNQISGTLTTGCPAEEGLGSAIVLNGVDPSVSTPVTSIVSNTLYNNIASAQYSSDKGGGAALNITNQSTVYIEQNIMRNNVSTGYGGAFYLASTPHLYFLQNVVYGNKGYSGGLDIVIPGSSVGDLAGAIDNNTLYGNTATSNSAGSDIYIGGNLAQYEMVNNIVFGTANGQSAVNCGAQYAGQTITPLVLDHNDFYSLPSSTNTPVGGACTNPTGKNGNISQDPLFTDSSATSIAAGTANFLPLQGSPVIDTGNNGVLPYVSGFDILGNLRSSDGTGKGYFVIDMGAYEVQKTSTCTADCFSSMQLYPSTWTPTTGSSLTLTAELPTTKSTGMVAFYEDGASIGTAPLNLISNSTSPINIATFTVNGITAGLHSFYAIYSGDSTFAPTTSIYINLLVNAPTLQNTSTTLVASPNPATTSQTVLLTATVPAINGTIPPGKVYFLDGSVSLGNSTLNTSTGTATYSSTFTTGTHSLTAAFLPTDTTSYNGSTGSTTLTVNGVSSDVTATLTVTPSAITFGDTTTLTVNVVPAISGPTMYGTILFYDNGAPLTNATIVTNSNPYINYSYATKTLAVGTHTITCSYSGDTNYNAATCANSVTVTVAPLPVNLSLAATPTPAQALTPITVTATLTNKATGAALPFVSLTLTPSGGTPIVLSTNNAGIATFMVSGSVPSLALQAATTASGNYSGGTATLTIPILPNATTGTLIAQPTTAYEGQTVSVVASILDTSASVSAAGSISLYDGQTLLSTLSLPASVVGQTLASVTFPVKTLTTGTHTLSAVYTPTVNFLTTTLGTASVTINPSSFTLTATPSITIQTQHHGSITATVTSIGSFSGNIALSFTGTLPPVLTPTFAHNPVVLPANGTVSTAINLETDAIPNFYALLPFALLPLALRKRHRKFMLTAIFALAAMIPLGGCSGKYPASTPPGTYDLALQGTGTGPGGNTVTQTVHIKLIVTP